MFYSKQTGGFYLSEFHGESIPADAVQITKEQHAALMDGQSFGLRIVAGDDGMPTLAQPLPPTAEQLQAMFVAAIQQRLDTFAQTRGYDGILSACTYATSTMARFASEGQACVELRDFTWAAGHAILQAVQSDQRPMPTMDEVMAELPALEWPQ